MYENNLLIHHFFLSFPPLYISVTIYLQNDFYILRTLCCVLHKKTDYATCKVSRKNYSTDLDVAWAVKVERIYYVRERTGIIKTSRQRGSKDQSRLGERQTCERTVSANCCRNWAWFSLSQCIEYAHVILPLLEISNL